METTIYLDATIQTSTGNPSEGITSIIVRTLWIGDGNGMGGLFGTAVPVEGGNGGCVSDR